MKSSDFFREEQDPEWELKGLDPWTTRTVFNAELIERLRVSPEVGIKEIDAAYGLADLAHEQLLAYGTNGNTSVDDDEISLVLRALRAILKRLSIEFDPPFRNFRGFHGYWTSQDMGGSWAARRSYLNDLFAPVTAKIARLEEQALEQRLATPISPRSTLGWLKVDEEIAHLRQAFSTATSRQQYSNIGNGCVRVLEMLGDMIHDPAKHLKPGESSLPRDKTKERFDRYVEEKLPGKENVELRRLVRAAIELAHQQKHRTSPHRRDVGIAADAVIMVANMLRRLAEPASVDADTGRPTADKNQ